MKTLVDEIYDALIVEDPQEFDDADRQHWFERIVTPIILRHEQNIAKTRPSFRVLERWVEAEVTAMEFLRTQWHRLNDVVAGFEQRGMHSNAADSRRIKGEVESCFLAHRVALQNMQAILKVEGNTVTFDIALDIRNTLPTPYRLNKVLTEGVTVPPAYEGAAHES